MKIEMKFSKDIIHLINNSSVVSIDTDLNFVCWCDNNFVWHSTKRNDLKSCLWLAYFELMGGCVL